MKPSPTTSLARLPPGWTDVLAKVQEHLTKTLQEVESRQKALGPAEPGEPAPTSLPICHDLAQHQERLQQLENLPQKAEQALADLEKSFRQEEETLRHYLNNVESTRRRLAKGAGCAVG